MNIDLFNIDPVQFSGDTFQIKLISMKEKKMIKSKENIAFKTNS